MGCHEAASARYGPVRRDSYIRYEVTENGKSTTESE